MSFGLEFLQFFKDLANNNNRDWFQAHRNTYLEHVKQPFTELVEQMIARIEAIDPEVQIDAKDAIYRIHRDLRFSKDKTPYQTHVSAGIAKGGKKSNLPGFYFQLGAEKLWIVGGLYQIEKDDLKKIRTEIAYCGKEFRDIIEHRDFRKNFDELRGEKNKIIPAEFKETMTAEPLIANRQFYYMTEMDSSMILQPDLSSFLMQYYHWGQPMNKFLKRALVD